MKEFICVRLIHMNGLDLKRYDFDYDQTLAIFFLQADQTIYARYGAATGHKPQGPARLALGGFRETMERVLALHKNFATTRDSLAAKQRQLPPPKDKPEQLVYGEGRSFTGGLDWDGKVVQSCIHCHMVRAATREALRRERKPMTPQDLRPYPRTEEAGFSLDAATASRVTQIIPHSAAALAGMQPGDVISTVEGAPIASLADVEWMLHHAGPEASLAMQVERGGKQEKLKLSLKLGWRDQGDASWRTSEWEMRRLGLGGMKLRPLTPEERYQAALAKQAPALMVEHVGQYGAHAKAKNAGWQKGDILLAVEGYDQLRDESSLIRHLLTTHAPGSQVPATRFRQGNRQETVIPVP